MTTSTTHDHLQGILDAQDTILLSLSTLARMFKDVSKTINKWGVKQEEGIWSYLRTHSSLFDDLSASFSKLADDLGLVRIHIDFIRSLEVSLHDLKLQKDSVLAGGLEKSVVDLQIKAKEDSMPGLKRTMITQWMKAHYRAFLGLGKETTVVGECGVALIESFTNEAPDKASIPSYDLSEGLARRVDRRLRKHGFSPSRDSSRGRSSRPRRRATSEVAASEAYSGTRRSYRRTVSEVAGIVGFGDAQESSFDFIPSRSRESSPRPDHLSSPLPIFTVYSPPPSLVKEDSRVNGTLPAPPQPQIESAPSPVGQSRVSMWKRPLRFFSRAMKVRKEPKSQPSDPPRGPSGSTAPTTADIPTSSTAPQSSGDAVRKEPKAQRSDWPRGRNRSTAPRTGTNGPVPSTTITRRDGSLAPSSSSRVTTLELEWE